MGWRGIIKELVGTNGIISPLKSEDRIVIPMEYLPKGCRVGDVLKFSISFDAFDTLNLIKSSQGENN